MNIIFFPFFVLNILFQIKVPSFSETLSALNVVQVAGGSKSLFAGMIILILEKLCLAHIKQ